MDDKDKLVIEIIFYLIGGIIFLVQLIFGYVLHDIKKKIDNRDDKIDSQNKIIEALKDRISENEKSILLNEQNDKNKEKEYNKIYDLVKGLSDKIENFKVLLIRLEEAVKHK